MNREQLKHLALAGTVTFPATFPRLAEIRLRRDVGLPLACGEQDATFLVAIERPSPRVTMRRILRVSDVRAVFVPRDPRCVDVNDGTWLLGPEVETGLRLQMQNRRSSYGIVFVAENTSTLLSVQAGMTAAESAQYYPPLPCDRSVNHYDPYRHQRSAVARSSPDAHGPLYCEAGYEHASPEVSYCETDYGRVQAEAMYCEGEYGYFPPSQAAYCEADYPPSQAQAQAERFDPAPYPHDGSQD